MDLLKRGAVVLMAIAAVTVTRTAQAQWVGADSTEAGTWDGAARVAVSPVRPPAAPQPGVWPPRSLYTRRSNGLFITGVTFASIGATVLAFGVAVYGSATDSCLDQVHGGSGGGVIPPPSGARRPELVREPGLFCTADRSQFDAGMGMMAAGGALFSLGLPLAVFGGANAATPTRSGLTLSPRGVGYVATF